MSFDTILGNEKIKNLLKNTVSSHNLLHSYLFIGPNGIGKSLFAQEFAEMILCLSDSKPCHACSSCVKFDSHNHPDFLMIDSEDGKSIKINQIRYLQEKIAEKPILSNRKVYVINNSDLMTTEAQNCLLKTLEEPPEYATIILVLANENKLLNTIKSRGTKILFSSLSNDELEKYAKENNIAVNSALLTICEGSIAKLLDLQNNTSAYATLDVLLQDLPKKDIVDIWNEADILYGSKDSIVSLLDYLILVLFQQLKDTKEEKYQNSIKIIEMTKKRLSANANYDMCIDNLLLKIWEEFHESNNRNSI